MVRNSEDVPVYGLRDLVSSIYEVGRMNPKQIERFADKIFLDPHHYWDIVEGLAEKKCFERKSAKFKEIEQNGYRSIDYAMALLYCTTLSLEEISNLSKKVPEYTCMEDIAGYLAKQRYQNLVASKKVKKAELPQN